MRRLVRLVARLASALIVAVLVFGGGWWAGRSALQPPSGALAANKVVQYRVEIGTVSRQLTLSANADWPSSYTIQGGRAGTVTSVDAIAGSALAEGASVLSIDLQPIVVANGAIPMFRTLSVGVSGLDVSQLQAFLARQGYPDRGSTGVFGVGTAAAVRLWQRAGGMSVTGVVELGSMVFVPATPLLFRPLVIVGSVVEPGQALGDVLASAPKFVIPVTDAQLALIPAQAAVEVARSSGTWRAITAAVDSSDAAGKVLILIGAGGTAVCADSCSEVPIDTGSAWNVAITLVPSVEGPVVPVAAVRTGPDGATSVVSADGLQLSIRVLGSADGLAVVDGIEPGLVITLPTVTG